MGFKLRLVRHIDINLLCNAIMGNVFPSAVIEIKEDTIKLVQFESEGKSDLAIMVPLPKGSQKSRVQMDQCERHVDYHAGPVELEQET